MLRSILRLAASHRTAGPLTDVSKLRYQAVFLMGAGGSGKGHVGNRWMKYMPGGPPGGIPPEQLESKLKEHLTDAERGLSNLKFESTVKKLRAEGFEIELPKEEGSARIPFRLYTYDQRGSQQLVDPSRYESVLPSALLQEVEGLKDVIFSTPVHELPSYWRQVNPDIYKEELAGYLKEEPGYVHEMSSEMSKAYFDAALLTGDPVFVDGTGSNPVKMLAQMKAAKDAGYRTSVVLVLVPMTVNHIRNATRPRNVSPNEITRQWNLIVSSFAQIRGQADKSKVILNRNDSVDIAMYKKHSKKINDFVAQKTSYDSLYALIAAEAPKEIAEWGPILAERD